MVLALAGAEVAFEPPERGDHRCRHAEFLLLAIEQHPVLLDLGSTAREPPACQHLVGHLQEGLRKETLPAVDVDDRSEEHTSELQSLRHLVCRLLLEKKKK